MFLAWCRKVAANPKFQNSIIVVIVMNAVLIGCETSPVLMARWGEEFHALNLVFLAIFTAEIVIRMAACAPRWADFFKSGWNVFDFAVVILSLIPAVGPLTTIARVARLLRVTRLISFSPQLRLIVTTMLRSVPSIGHIALLMGLLIYVYAVTGVHLFASLDPEKWGNIGRAALTLFEVITLEGWVEFQDRLTPTLPMAWLFFMSFIVMAVFVMVNLLIAVVINNMEDIKAEGAAADGQTVRAHIQNIRRQLDDLESKL